MTNPRAAPLRWFRRLGWALGAVGLSAVLGWTGLAIHYSGPGPPPMRDGLAIGCVAAQGLLLLVRRHRPRARATALALSLLALGWWLAIPPRNDRDWQPDVARPPWAERDGDAVTLHDVRDNEYRTEADYTVRYVDRRLSLARLRTVDLFLAYWGSPFIAHTVVSFGFDDEQYVAVSIETRKERGEDYSAVAGFFKQYELIYVVADERDVIRLRTNYRGEDVYLYRIRGSPETARRVFLGYLDQINRLHDRPRWYSALTQNCTTSILEAAGPAAIRSWRSWKLLVNGYLDELAFENGAVEQSLPFAELRARSRITDRARAADGDPAFSRRIRAGLPGFPP